MAQISAKNFDFWYMDGSLFLQNGYMDGWHFKNPSGTPLPRPKLSTPPGVQHRVFAFRGLYFDFSRKILFLVLFSFVLFFVLFFVLHVWVWGCVGVRVCFVLLFCLCFVLLFYFVILLICFCLKSASLGGQTWCEIALFFFFFLTKWPGLLYNVIFMTRGHGGYIFRTI